MLPHWPHDLWCQRFVGRDAFFPAVERARRDRLVPLVEPVDENLALLLELPHGVAHVGDAILVGQHRAAVDLGLHPGGGGARLARRQVGRAPFGAEAGEGRLAVVSLVVHCFLRRSATQIVSSHSAASSSSSCSSSHSLYSSRFSSITSLTTSNRFSSTISS